MKKVIMKNITKFMLPLIVKTIDGSKTFTISVKPNTSVELFETQITGDVTTKLSHRWLIITGSQNELGLKTTVTPRIEPTVRSQIKITEKAEPERKKRYGR
jgi:hypothetical protein